MKIIGIDADTKSITAAIMDGATISTVQLRAEGRTADERRRGLLQQFDDWLVDAAEKYRWDEISPFYPSELDLVVVERPVYGRNIKATIDQAYIVGGIYALLSTLRNILVLLVDNTIWKKAILGSGKASKEDIKAYAQGKFKMSGDLVQDMYDAVCIAEWGYLRMERKDA